MNNIIACNTEIKDLDEKGVVVFYANTFGNTDSDGDVSQPGAFSKTIKDDNKRFKHLKWHDTRYMPGVIKEISEDAVGLLVKSQLILNTQLGRETYEEYKAVQEAGRQMEHSVRVNAIKYEQDNDTGIRKVSEWRLWEVSTLTAWGANDKAVTVSLKDLEGATREQIEQEIIFLKSLLNITSYKDIKLEQIEKQISFLTNLKAGGKPDETTCKTTLEEFKEIFGLV